MKSINLLITLILLSTAVQAQNFSGKIVDEKAQGVAFANVVLFALPDSTFVCGTTSDDNGNFEITDNSLSPHNRNMDPRAQFQLHPLLVRNAQLQELQIRQPNAGHQPRQHPYATPKIHTLRGRIL